ncbi:HAMP domain-containing sensor histidine kinase [Piscinibacter terrae]|uniref:histidine kinase n=1 Tax=Piscinibacter terrae TaxID=2496871 RepID=A0A3N7HSJ0_9BURK|nr:HAMP domain-containing sensor histidine kinase [Albitalea terrae]RQP24206.1 sensor histidine kinase [Albitalea terrae]
MSRSIWWRFFAISMVFALLMSLAYLWLMRETSLSGRGGVQRSVLLFVARIVEDGPIDESMRRLDGYLADSPEVPRQMWVVDATGRVLAARSANAPPLDWLAADRPQQPHEMHRIAGGGLRGPAVGIVRLAGSEPRYLVARFTGLPGRPLLMQQLAAFVIALAGAVFLGLTLITLYLRLRSRQAREVIARLEAGDLRARFVPERLDALGVLMLDFNRMADEIERLVGRLQQAEDARRSLLQELGHDLRTPLTSLRTSIETVSVHGQAMPELEREAFIGIINSELEYFVRLIDDLFFIADIAEPHYRKNSDPLALADILRSEMAAFQAREGLRFRLDAKDAGPVSGDRMLLARVFRNALDNAARHARGQVDIAVAAEGPMVRVAIQDDGPGMGAQAIAAFGQRRHQRLQAGAANPSMSLGLGSVIIRTIVELHGGRWTLESGAAVQGTRLCIWLPAADVPRPASG